ncbi:MAG: hypothetical protein ACI8RP_000006 [Urechidicola sp.]|jgi:hypothetical protein|tara:strand:+ start:1891 stop:3180 length:1290 start_codon:yes stop_codon:yes gene_type:complete
MKKITLLVLLISTVFTGFAQDVEYNFNTDGDNEGWEASGVNLTTASGIMNVEIISPTNGFQGTRSSDALALAEANYLTLRIVVENNVLLVDGTTPVTAFQIINYDTGSTSIGDAVKTDVTIPAGGYNTMDIMIPSNPDNSGTIDRLGLRIKSGANTLDASSNFNLDSAIILFSGTVTSTFSGFVQNPCFENVTGDIAPWVVTGDGTSSLSTDASVGAQAVKVDLTGTSNTFLENGYTWAFDSPQVVASTGDQVTITWDMKSNSTALKVAGRFILGGAENQVLVTAAKSVTVADTYESFSVTKVLDAQDGNFYDNINSLSFRIQLGEVGDYVFIDNVTTTVTINGAVLNVEKNGLESFTMYPNPVNDILNIISVNDINEIKIFDMTGKNVYARNEIANNQINVSSLNPGIYFIKIKDINNSISTKKLIKN